MFVGNNLQKRHIYHQARVSYEIYVNINCDKMLFSKADIWYHFVHNITSSVCHYIQHQILLYCSDQTFALWPWISQHCTALAIHLRPIFTTTWYLIPQGQADLCYRSLLYSGLGCRRLKTRALISQKSILGKIPNKNAQRCCLETENKSAWLYLLIYFFTLMYHNYGFGLHCLWKYMPKVCIYV